MHIPDSLPLCWYGASHGMASASAATVARFLAANWWRAAASPLMPLRPAAVADAEAEDDEDEDDEMGRP